MNEFWTGAGGDAYTARNRVNWRARIPFWRGILDRTGARSVYEVGCNAGWNLSAIQAAGYSGAEVRSRPAVYGHDLNWSAAQQAKRAGLAVTTRKLVPGTVDTYCNPLVDHPSAFELVFTAGVLIHVPSAELGREMRLIVRASADYVLAIEYAADQEEEIEYRGQRGLLWRRPFGGLYQGLGLELVESGDAGSGFDRCAYWLLRKPAEDAK